MYLRARCTELAINFIEEGGRPRFEHFFKFIKDRAKLVSNEFGRDMSVNTLKQKLFNKETDLKFTSLATAEGSENEYRPKPVCQACSGLHRIWKCESFKMNDCKTKRKIVLQNGLCNKCLERGHIARNCLKLHFKCL